MSGLYGVLRLGPGATAAQRQVSAAYLAGSVIALTGSFLEQRHGTALWMLGGVCLLLAAAAWWLPWNRWHSQATLVLAIPAFAILAWSITVFGPVDPIPAAFFVLLFVWAGLHHRPLGVLALTPLAIAADLVPALASGLPLREVLFRSVLLALIMVLVGLVISDRVDRLERAKARLARAEQWRTALMLSLAHDIRAPLTAVQTTLEMINSGDASLAPGERGSLTTLALRQTARIQQLASGLIEIERVEADQLMLNQKELALQPAVHEAIARAGVDAVVRTEPRLWVRADPTQLDQILVNLLGNARDHGRPPVVVVAGRVGDFCEITVRDHGEGVPAGRGADLFERFTTGDAPGSVGLGLWAARQLTLAHGGELRYEPARPGARFVLTLPAVDGSPEWGA